jgi:hypothetical protein
MTGSTPNGGISSARATAAPGYKATKLTIVGPENSRRLIMLKIFFRIAILLPYELHFIFRDRLRDERVALPTFPTA